MTTPPSGMAARDIDERVDATDEVNKGVKQLQKGTSAKMILTGFMVEIEVESSISNPLSISILKQITLKIEERYLRSDFRSVGVTPRGSPRCLFRL